MNKLAQAVLPILFNIVKPFINKNTVSKIFFYGTNKEEWIQALLEEIDSDQLPAYYGGSLTDDGDPQCPNKVNKLVIKSLIKQTIHLFYFCFHQVQHGRANSKRLLSDK